MKLSNPQIRAIIDEVAKKEQVKLDADYKKAKDAMTKEKTPVAKKYFATYNALPADLRKHLSPYDRVTEATILHSLVTIEKKSFNRSELESKIILASIDSADLEELKMKLKLSF